MNQKILFKSLRACKQTLIKFNKDLPKEDEFITARCIALDLIKEIDLVIKDIGPAIKDAKDLKKKNK